MFSTYIHLLQILGITIINCLWQAALICLCYVIINTLFTLSSSKKYLLSVIGELLIFAWFIISFASNLYSPTQFYPTKIFTQVASSNKEWLSSSALPVVSFVYLIVLIGMIIKWLINFYNTQKIYHKNLIPFKTQWQQWLEQKSVELNIKKSIKIFVTKYVHVPLTIGIFKPVILLPVAIANYLTVEELETILLHELAHIKRSDYLMNIFLSLVETVLYFNPFISYFKRIIKKERENICDDEVLLQHYTPVKYAESLLKLAKFSLNKKELAFAMNATNNQQQLLQRIQRITQTKIQQKNKAPFVISFSLFIILFTTIGFLYIPTHNQTSNNKKNSQVTISLTNVSSTSQKSIKNKDAAVKNRKAKHKIIPDEIEKDRADNNLNVALENLKQINIPSLQNNIEEYRKNLSGEDAKLLADNNLKQKIKNYVSSKNISMNDFIRKIDSVKINQENFAALNGSANNNSFIIPASYIEKDSLNQYIQKHKQIKHFVVIPNTNAAPYYIIVRTINENKEATFIFIPYKPEQIVD